MVMVKIPEEVEKKIVEAIKEGKKTYQEIANEFNVAKSTVSAVAKRNNIQREQFVTKKAVEAKKKWDKQRRLELLGKFFDKCNVMLFQIEEPRELKDLITALGIAIDKARLEEGEPTERIESNERIESKSEMEVRNHGDIGEKLKRALGTVERVLANYIPGNDTQEQVDSSRTDGKAEGISS